MSYDNTFDQTRLNQLASQHLENSELVGRVLFLPALMITGWILRPGNSKAMKIMKPPPALTSNLK